MENSSFELNATVKPAIANEVLVWTAPTVLKGILSMIYVVIFLIGTAGNASVIYTLSIKRKISTKQGHGLIVALAVTDFFSSIALPFVMINDLISEFKWYFGSVGCIILPALSSLFLFASAWILAAIAWERMR